MKKIEIIPAIIPTDFSHLRTEIHRVASFVKTIQIDVVDGIFAPVTTWPYTDVNDFEWKSLVAQESGLPHWEDIDFEIDLMVNDQIAAAKEWIAAGVCRVIGHIESFHDEDIEQFLALKDLYGVELVMALVPSTPNTVLDPFLDRLDGVQFMGSDTIGHHGVVLDDRVYEKIRTLRVQKPELPISVDIGVNFDTAPKLVAAGATKLASGSLILQAADVEEVIAQLGEVVS